MPSPYVKQGYQSKLANLYNSRKGERAVVICNGPSLSDTPVDFIKSSVSIGCNGIYKQFSDWGFTTDYLVFEDVQQFEIRSPDLAKVKGPLKLAALYNSYAVSDTRGWVFFNSPRSVAHQYYWSDGLYPQFSLDFASIVHLGSTVTYIMLQLAYFLGCDPVYIVGLDFSYGKLSDMFPPGKIVITPENYDIVKTCHVDPNYYKIGDIIGVPNANLQRRSFAKANQIFNLSGRTLLNASARSSLDVIKRVSI
nr:6-hydroxymethylpterin diphosphokinase MptE-like protein [Synechococcus sp. RS9907]